MTGDESQGPSEEDWIPDPGAMVAYATGVASNNATEGAGMNAELQKLEGEVAAAEDHAFAVKMDREREILHATVMIKAKYAKELKAATDRVKRLQGHADAAYEASKRMTTTG